MARICRLYTPQPLAPGDLLTLEAGPSRHLVKVLRAGAGAPVELFNGDGLSYQARLEQADHKAAKLTVLEAVEGIPESSLRVSLGIGVSRGERMDQVVQKSTELGVHRISPIVTERSQVKYKEPQAQKRATHWRNISVSACEQCGRNQLPELESIGPLDPWLRDRREDCRLVLVPDGPAGLPTHVSANSIALLVGPEGGLSQAEIDRAIAAGFSPVGLGPRILRTETAPLAALAILQYCMGDLG